MRHTACGVLLILPTLLSCGAGSASLAPATDTGPEVAADAAAAADGAEDIAAPDTPRPADLAPLPACITDDDCHGLAAALPVCVVVVCDGGTCVQTGAVDGTWCDEGIPCRLPGICAEGACDAPDDPCEDGDPCTGVTCDPYDGCLYEPLDGVACDDGDHCTAMDLCVEGVCVGDGDYDCDDGNPCTADGCDPWFGCVHEDLVGPCDDGDPCTGDDECVYGTCVGAADICECDTDDDCMGLANACFSAYTCDVDAVPRVCVPAPETETACPDVSPCQAGICNPVTETCDPVPKPDGTPCADPGACVAEGECVEGACVGTSVECPGEGTVCTVPACVPGEGCTEVHAPGPCDDGDPCTVNGWCVDAACASLDTGCEAAPPALFRVTAMAWLGPGLTFSAPGNIELAMEEAAGVAIGQALVDPYSPLDILLGIGPMDTAAPALLKLGAGGCIRDDAGVVTGCPWPGDDQDLGVVAWCLDPGSCDGIPGASDPPGFGASGDPDALVLTGGLGGILDAAAAEIGGQLQDLPNPTGITAGTLSLFLDEEAAALAALYPPLMAPLTLAELLDPAASTDVDGLHGWWIHLGFEAERIPVVP